MKFNNKEYIFVGLISIVECIFAFELIKDTFSVCRERGLYTEILIFIGVLFQNVVWRGYIESKKKNIVIKYDFLGYMFLLFLYLQCLLGIMWACSNLFFLPEFGDTGEYLKLSEFFYSTEIRSILYPLIIKLCRLISKEYFQIPLYLLQFLLGGYSVYYLLNVIKEASKKDWNKYDLFIYTNFLLLVPQVLEFHFSVLTDSLACSMLLILTAVGIKWICSDLLVKDIVLGMVSVTCSLLLRYERKVLCPIFLIGVALTVIYFRKNYKKTMVILLFLYLIPSCIAGIVDSTTYTQTERHKESISTRLCAKYVSGNMAEYYENLPDKIKDVFTFEMAHDYDEKRMTTSEVLYAFENTVGVREANNLIYKLSADVLKASFGKEILYIFKDCLLYANPLVFGMIELNGVHVGGLDWNYSRMIMNTPVLSKLYYHFSLCLGIVFLTFSTVLLTWNEKNTLKKNYKMWLPVGYIIFLLVCLFGIVNSSKPNDRYVLCIYIFWFLYMIFQLEEWESLKSEK